MYRKGKENVAADALSRQGWEPSHSPALTAVTPAWVTELEESYKGDPTYDAILKGLVLQPEEYKHYTYKQGILRYKGKVCIGNSGDLRRRVVEQFHCSALRGHSRVLHTYQRAKCGLCYIWI